MMLNRLIGITLQKSFWGMKVFFLIYTATSVLDDYFKFHASLPQRDSLNLQFTWIGKEILHVKHPSTCHTS